MNQTFSFARLARLNSWFWAIKGRTYLLAAGALFVLIMLILSQVLAPEDTPKQLLASGVNFINTVLTNHIVYFNFLVLILAGSIGNDVYSSLYRQESAITYLMIPGIADREILAGCTVFGSSSNTVCLGLLGLRSHRFQHCQQPFSRQPNRLVRTHAALLFHGSLCGKRYAGDGCLRQHARSGYCLAG